jgi:ABC-type Fe3+/spermidine/putrescine transport system ATPase subunit
VEREVSGRFIVRTEIGSILAAPGHANGTHVGSEVRLVFRPEYCRISQTPAESENNRWACTVERSVFLGHCTEYLARVRSTGIVAKVMGRLRFDEGASAWISINPEDVRVLTVE